MLPTRDLSHSQDDTTHKATTTANNATSCPKFKPAEAQLTDQTNILPFKKLLVCFLGLGLCIIVSTLDSVTVATALPTISSVFNAGSISSWVPSAYLLTSTSFQPLYGRFSDIFGRKATLTAAILIFMIGNLGAGFSRTILELIVLRGFAGAGGGAITSVAQIIVSDIVSLRERGKYQGITGGIVTIGYVIGPIIGGALAQHEKWQWVFWLNIPIAFLSILVVNFVLPLKPVYGDIRKKLLVVDYVGCALTLIGCTLIILPLIWGGVTFPWSSAIIIGPLIGGFATWALFVVWEWKGAVLPIIPMRIFTHATVCGVYVTMFINGLITFSTMFYLPQFFYVALHYTPIHAGLFLIPLLGGQVIVTWMAGIAVSRTGRYLTIVHSGFAILSLGCGLISMITPHTHQVVLVVYMLLIAIGTGQTLQTTTVAVQASVSRQDMSVVTVLRNFARMLGGTLALAVGAALINNTLRSSMKTLSIPEKLIKLVIDDPTLLSYPASINLSSEQASSILENGYMKGFRLVFILNASLSAVATITSILLIKHKSLTRDDDEGLKREAGRKESRDEEKGKLRDEREKRASAEGALVMSEDHDHSRMVEITIATSPGASSAVLSERFDQHQPLKDEGTKTPSQEI